MSSGFLCTDCGAYSLEDHVWGCMYSKFEPNGEEKKEKGGTKHDQGKPRISLIPYEFIAGLASVLTFGAKKYGSYNWTKGFDYSRLLDATYRHIGQFESGQDIDEESGLSHLLHATCGLMFLYMHTLLKLGNDDRWKRGTK